MEQERFLDFVAILKRPSVCREKGAIETHSYGAMRSYFGAEDLGTVLLEK
jgi:hypothetical protein